MTLDTVADESRKKIPNGAARSPSRLCSRDGKISCYGDALNTISLFAGLCGLLPTFRFAFYFSCPIFFMHPGMCIFFVSLRLCNSHLLLSASTYFIVRFLSPCVICTPPHLGILLFLFDQFSFFRSSYFSGGVFFCCAVVPSTLELIGLP